MTAPSMQTQYSTTPLRNLSTTSVAALTLRPVATSTVPPPAEKAVSASTVAGLMVLEDVQTVPSMSSARQRAVAGTDIWAPLRGGGQV